MRVSRRRPVSVFVVLAVVVGSAFAATPAAAVAGDVTPPVVTFISPAPGSTIEIDDVVVVQGETFDDSAISGVLRVDGTATNSVNRGPGTHTFLGGLGGDIVLGWHPASAHTVTLDITDEEGNHVVASSTFYKQATGTDGVTITGPTGTVEAGTVTITGSLAADTYSSPYYLLDGSTTAVPFVPAADGSFSFDLPGIGDGVHRVIISEGAGLWAEGFTFVADGVPPAIEIQSPAPGTVYQPGAIIPLRYRVTDASPATSTPGVWGYGGNPYDPGACVTGLPCSNTAWSTDATHEFFVDTSGWPDGAYQVGAAVGDGFPSHGTSQYVVVYVDGTKPQLNIKRPDANTTVRGPRIVGTASDSVGLLGLVVELRDTRPDGTCTATVVASQSPAIVDGEWTADFTGTPGLVDGDYCVRAVATDIGGLQRVVRVTPVTVDNTTPAVPTPVAPVGFVESATQLDWSDAEEPGVTFEYRFGEPGDLVDAPIATGADLTDSFVAIDSLPAGRYAWQVRAKDAVGNRSDWSPVQRFAVIGTPEISSCGCAFSDTLRIDWDYAVHPDAIGYQVRFRYVGGPGPDDNGEPFTVEVGHVRRLTQSFDPGLPEGNWRVRVRAVLPGGILTDWSDSVRFTRDVTAPDTPTLISPFDGAAVDPLDSLRWSPNGDWFEVQIGLVGDDDPLDMFPFGVSTGLNEFPMRILTDPGYIGLPEGTEIWWRVRGIDDAGNRTAWTQRWHATVDSIAPERVRLQSPTDASTRSTNDVTFTWSRLERGLKYEFEYGPSEVRSGGKLEGSTRSTVDVNSAVLNDLADGTWYWRVRAIDSAGHVGPWSRVWSVTVDTPTPVVPKPKPAAFGSMGDGTEEPTPTPTSTEQPRDSDEPDSDNPDAPADDDQPQAENAAASEGLPLFWFLIGGIVIVVVVAGGFVIRFFLRRA